MGEIKVETDTKMALPRHRVTLSPFHRVTLSGPVLGLLGVLGIFIVLISLKGELGNFLSIPNLQVLLKDATIPAVIALGMLLIIISGGIDLSVGSVAALVTVTTMYVYRLLYAQSGSMAFASAWAVPAGIAVGGVCGLTNGLIITQLRVTPFVASLGMLSIARGLAYWISERRTLDFPRQARPEWVNTLAQVYAEIAVAGQRLPSLNPGFWSLMILAFGVAVLLHFTVLGRYCYAIGSNEATARLCGVAIGRTKIILYTLAGLLTGWAGILMFAQGGSGDPSAGVGLELEVIAAVVIGGASLTGGRGTVFGTLLGVLILAVLNNGVSLFNVPVEVRFILIGGIIIINTALSQWQRQGQ